MADHAKLAAFVDGKWDDIVTQLSTYVTIENQSPMFDPAWASKPHTDNVVSLFKTWVEAQKVPGLTLEVLREGNRTPLIFIEVPSTGGAGNTVLMYGERRRTEVEWARRESGAACAAD